MRARRPPANPVLVVGMILFACGLLAAGMLAGHIHHQKPLAAANLLSPTTRVMETIKGSVDAGQAAPGCASAANGVQKGAQVNVVDPQGRVLGTTTLGAGLPDNKGGCTWSYTVRVPLSAGYQIQVAQLPVAGITKIEMERTAWNVYENDTTNTQNLIGIESGV